MKNYSRQLLNVTDRMFNNNALWQIHQRKTAAKWRLYRINRWILEVVFDNYIQKKIFILVFILQITKNFVMVT